MINYLFLIPILFLHNIILSQENLLTENEFPVFPVCKLVPVKNQSICFDQSISEHIEKYFVFPETAKELGLQSVVNVSFIIDVDGKVNNITATSSLVGVEFNDKSALLVANKIFEDAASEIIKKLPIMQPAKVNGEFVSFPLKVPIVYRLNSNKINLDDIFTIDQVDYAPLIENNPEISKEESIKLFENYIDDFFKKNLKNPRKNKEKKDEVIVFVEIIIENDGIIYEMSSIGPEIYRAQVEKVVKKLPELFPAKIDNYPVAVTYSFPVKFNLK